MNNSQFIIFSSSSIYNHSHLNALANKLGVEIVARELFLVVVKDCNKQSNDNGQLHREQLDESNSLKQSFINVLIQSLESLLASTLTDIHSLSLEIKPDNTQDCSFIVAPRLGTTSPWSSKATEIAKRSQLHSVTRIERMVHFCVKDTNVNTKVHCDANNENHYAPTTQKYVDIINNLHDPMIESVIRSQKELNDFFTNQQGSSYKEIDILKNGKGVLQITNKELGLALSNHEIDYLYKRYIELNRNPSDVELMMFAQANSEHCRHKIFNSHFVINNEEKQHTPFELIKQTFAHSPNNVVVAYNDNSSIIKGSSALVYGFDYQYTTMNTANDPSIYQASNYKYAFTDQVKQQYIIMKVETHNHPTAIEPFAGAATGNGGEIRDEGATGVGAKPKAGITGFSVSYLDLPGLSCPTYINTRPPHIKSALEIMLAAPIGGASFNNEFGRAGLCGYWRSFEQTVDGVHYGYHKPIMLAGGMGNIHAIHSHKKPLNENTVIVQLGGPGFLIGLGGGSASSLASGENQAHLDFSSVQRSNPEMQRRCQAVLNYCTSLKEKNPILSIHDIGAGGLANAVPEIIHTANCGGRFELRNIPIEDNNMSPLEIWCNESQERYVIAIDKSQLEDFYRICKRENCPVSAIGVVTKEQQLVLSDSKFNNTPINVPLDLLFTKQTGLKKEVQYTPSAATSSINLSTTHTATINHQHSDAPINNSKTPANNTSSDIKNITDAHALTEAIYKVVSHPTVANKSFLINIGDRSVGGLTMRDQMVGKWQIPVSDYALTASSFLDYSAEAMSVGERTPVATINVVASVRLAIAEALTNLAGSGAIEQLSDIKLSANWMASCGSANQDALLYQAVESASMLCRELGIAIPVGKDSLSMKTTYNNHEVIAPLSLIICAFAPLADARHHKTALLDTAQSNTAQSETAQLGNNKLDNTATTYLPSSLVLIGLNNKTRIGASILQECYGYIEGETANVENGKSLVNLLQLINTLHQQKLILAYHDRSDGGLIATLCEILFVNRIGIEVLFTEETNNDDNIIRATKNHTNEKVNNNHIHLYQHLVASLFNEEVGVVIQIADNHKQQLKELVAKYGLYMQDLARLNTAHENLIIKYSSFEGDTQTIINESRLTLEQAWTKVSYTMRCLRDNPKCADEEYQQMLASDNRGLFYELPFTPSGDLELSPYIAKLTGKSPQILKSKPKVAILREQGVNSEVEMAAAFSLAGFDAFDMHMNDLINNPNISLKDFVGVAICGGFSYGDVLGAGVGWAKSILFNPRLHEEFSQFFMRHDTFALGVCNGCQMMSALKGIIPHADSFPQAIKRNLSEQFEARLVMVEVMPSNSIFFSDMVGAKLPIIVSHGEGLMDFSLSKTSDLVGQYPLRFIDSKGQITTTYPFNPNGTKGGITAACNNDGRFTIMMPHPERSIRTMNLSWYDKSKYSELSPWFKIFLNAYQFARHA